VAHVEVHDGRWARGPWVTGPWSGVDRIEHSTLEERLP
jgi:hypothetical protein